ncbi:MAG: GNAT family N-acetyltransferase [Proteobacteria bacterium]|nr:GNAT family N-acetyltransferase [Pseudomonadota bacterium]
MSEIIFRTDKNIDITKLADLTEVVGWGRRNENSWESILSKSSLVITAWDDDNLVGLGRILEDSIMCMVYDVAIHPDYQGKGVGSKIMQNIASEIKNQNFHSVGLFAWDANPANIPFYEKFGFKAVNFGMKLPLSK